MSKTSDVATLLEKLKNLISSQPRKGKERAQTRSTANKNKGFSSCPYHFGYLKDHLKNKAVPKECLTCKKMLECRNRHQV